MNNEPTPNLKYKRNDLTFKRSAVELWLAGGKSAAAVAGELGIRVQALKTWKHRLAVTPPVSGVQTPAQLQAENHRLRPELTGALRRCDIPKKPWASSPNPAGTL